MNDFTPVGIIAMIEGERFTYSRLDATPILAALVENNSGKIHSKIGKRVEERREHGHSKSRSLG